MNQKSFKLLLVCLMAIWPMSKNTAQQLGGTTADAKMLSGGKSPGGMGSLYSANLYDGSANINIPIYQYSAEEGDYGISLSYNTKGVKVQEIASAAGLHWQINAGGGIQRVVKDLPDEINVQADSMAEAFIDELNDTMVRVNPYHLLKGKYVTYSEPSSTSGDATIYRDKECDDYVVSVGDLNVTFNLGVNGTIFTHPHRNIKVEVLLDGNTGINFNNSYVGSSETTLLLGFRITDEKGNRYIFERSDYEAKDVDDIHGQSVTIASYYLTRTWAIKKIILSNGSEIVYNYTDVLLNGFYTGKNWSLKEGYKRSDHPLSVNEPSQGVPKGKMLSSIQYPNGVIAYFNYDANKRADHPKGALKEIRVTAPSTCLSYQLKQSFFYKAPELSKTYAQGINTTNDSARLRLDSVILVSCDGSKQEPYYSFEYDAMPLPEKFNCSQDFFGYYNGKTHIPYTSDPGNKPTTIPYHEEWIPYNPNNVHHWYGMDKTSDISKMRACILTKLKNAYGGEVTLYYGAHQMDANALTNLPAESTGFYGKDADDGLRLDSIREWDKFHPENSLVTTYQYSGGKRFLTGGYFHYPGMIDYNTQNPIQIIYTGNYVTPHQLVKGSNHGYSNVSVTTKTGEGAQLSRTDYTFTNFSAASYLVLSGSKHYYEFPYTDKLYIKEWELGLPLTVTQYDDNNLVTLKTVNEFEYKPDTVSAIGNVENEKISKVNYNKNEGFFLLMKDFTDVYHPYTGRALLKKTKTYKYISNNAFVLDSVLYNYDGRNNLVDIITCNSKGERTKTVSIYNYNITSNNLQPIFAMTAAGLEKIIGSERWKLGTTTQADKLLSAHINTYTYQDYKLRNKSLYNLNISTPILYGDYTGYYGGPNVPPLYQNFHTAFAGNAVNYYLKTSEVLQSDAIGNPMETYLPEMAQYKSMIWDITTGQKMAEANCRYQDIGYTGFESANTGNFTYSGTAVSQVTDPMGGGNAFYLGGGNTVTRGNFTAGKEYIISFWATHFSSVPVCTFNGSPLTLTPGPEKGNWTYYQAKFNAGNSSQLLSISSASNAYLDEVRLFPVNSLMQSWNYSPILGVTSSTDATGRITYFEYDKLGRQAVVRDQEGNVLSKTEYSVQ